MGNRISILWADLMMTFPEIESGRVSAGHLNEVRFRITLYTANGKRQFVSRDLSFTAHYKKNIEIGFTPVSSIRIGLHSFHFRSILRKLSNWIWRLLFTVNLKGLSFTYMANDERQIQVENFSKSKMNRSTTVFSLSVVDNEPFRKSP